MYYDVRNSCKVCGGSVDGEGDATICTFCYNNHPELHYDDCPCDRCKRERELKEQYSWDETKCMDCYKKSDNLKTNFYGQWCPKCYAKRFPAQKPLNWIVYIDYAHNGLSYRNERQGASLTLKLAREHKARLKREYATKYSYHLNDVHIVNKVTGKQY